jgi:hypothetical protein
LVECGASTDSIFHYDKEVDALDAAMAKAKPGELVVMLALGDAAAISEKLLERGRIKP